MMGNAMNMLFGVPTFFTANDRSYWNSGARFSFDIGDRFQTASPNIAGKYLFSAPVMPEAGGALLEPTSEIDFKFGDNMLLRRSRKCSAWKGGNDVR